MSARQGRDGALQPARGAARRRGPEWETPKFFLTRRTESPLAYASGSRMLGRRLASLKIAAFACLWEHRGSPAACGAGWALPELRFYDTIGLMG
jgi:hypothetical protein